MRGPSTSAEQKPALSPPRINTIATRSAKRLSGAAPTSARAGASGAAQRRQKRQRSDRAGQRRGHRAASCARTRGASIADLQPRRRASRPFTLHSAGNANMVRQRFDSRGFHRHGRARHGLPRSGLVRRHGVRLGQRGRGGAYARRRGEAGLSQRRRDARRGQVPPSDRAIRGAQIRRRATQGRGAVSETLSYRR